MLERMLYLRPALDRLISFQYRLGPADFKLSEGDWEITERLTKVLEVFAKVTAKVSAVRYPTLYFQLPFFTYLLRELTKFIDASEEGEVEAHFTIHEACKEGWEILNSYWQKVDNHSSQAIALILDPRCKLETFVHLAWNNTWILTARRNLERVYRTSYFTQVNFAEILETTATEETDDDFGDALFGPSQPPAQLNPVVRGRHTASTTFPEIVQYLAEKAEDRKVDPVQWWKLNGHRFPTLARMAQDYLAVPASSVPSEQIFSQAGDIITKKRNRMLDTSCSSLLLIKSWMKQPEIELWELEKLELEDGYGSDGDIESNAED